MQSFFFRKRNANLFKIMMCPIKNTLYPSLGSLEARSGHVTEIWWPN